MRITQKIAKRIRRVSLVAILIATVGIVTVFATGTGYAIPWWTIDGGGGTSSGSNYTVSGTIGQADTATMSGGNYAVSGGFWSGSPQYKIYLPLVLKG